jgi:TPR repeat protein
VPSLIKLGRLQEAAATGNAEALYLYGMSLPDRADGANWLRRAAEKGHAAAMTEYARRSTDPSERKRWFESAAKAGDAEAMYHFGILSGDRDWLRKAAGKGSAPAMVALGEREWLEKAAGAGYANAYTKLGQLERAAELGDAEAKMLLGDGLRPKKPRQAYALYVEAAKSGYAPAMTRLGDCSLNGLGTSRSDIDALKWYREALSAGDPEAERKLRALGKTP